MIYLLMSWKTLNFAIVIELGRHIEILLLDYECVMVPGLGGFVAHHTDARYDEGDGLFLPPLRTLGFNPKLSMNDLLLVQSYVEAYDISYPDAVSRIESEVGELKQCLLNEGSYRLGDIGTLTLGEGGSYGFEPCEAGILTPALYGLGSFEMARLHKETTTPAAHGRTGASRHATRHEEGRDKGMEKKTATDDSSVIKIKVAWLRNAIAVAAAILAFFIMTPPITNSSTGRADFASLPQEIIGAAMRNQGAESVKPMPSKEQAAAEHKPLNKASQQAAEATAAEKASDETITVNEKPADYCIVLASRITKAGANAFAKQLCTEGLTEAKVYTGGGQVRVIYGAYATEDEARDTLRRLRDNKYFEQAWVYKKKQ